MTISTSSSDAGKFVTLFLSLIAIGLTGIISLNFIADPLQWFRKASWYDVHYARAHMRHQNAGLARSHQADILIIGNSTAAGFRHSFVEEALEGTALNLGAYGATGYEMRRTLELALKHQTPKRIIWFLHGFDLAIAPDQPRPNFTWPDRLYDDGPLADLVYLTDPIVLQRSLTELSLNWFGTTPPFAPSLDPSRDIFRDHDRVEVKGCASLKQDFLDRATDPNMPLMKTGVGMEFLHENFATNILPLIKKHKGLRIDIILPPAPYAFFRHHALLNPEALKVHITARNLIEKELSSFDHVYLHDFDLARHIAPDHDRYLDLTHFSSSIVLEMLSAIRDGRYIRTPNTKQPINWLADHVQTLTNEELFATCAAAPNGRAP